MRIFPRHNSHPLLPRATHRAILNLRIADIGNGRVWANAEGVQDPFTSRSVMRDAKDLHPIQETSASLQPDWLLSLPVRRVHAREQDRLHAGSFAPSRELSRFFERDES
jgi:hypothetical protein